MRRLAAALAASVVCVAPLAAEADEKAEKEARALFKEGNKALEDGNYVDALDMYRAAYARWPNPKILLNMGAALRALGRYAEAADAYEKYANDPAADAKKKTEVQGILAELAKKVGKIQIEVNEPGARVLVDGKEVGKSPQAITLRVDPGAHAVVAEKEGYALSAATVSVQAGEERVVQLRLVTAGGAPPPPDGDKGPDQPPPELDPDGGGKVADAGGAGAGGDGVAGAGGDGGAIRRSATPAPTGGGLGVFARWDTDPLHDPMGSVGVVGVTYGLGRSFELGAAAIIGSPAKGAWLGGRLLLGGGSLRPTLTAGVPIIMNDGTHVAAHGAAGLQIDVTPAFGIYLDVGAQYIFTVDTNAFVFMPSLGARLEL